MFSWREEDIVLETRGLEWAKGYFDRVKLYGAFGNPLEYLEFQGVKGNEYHIVTWYVSGRYEVESIKKLERGLK